MTASGDKTPLSPAKISRSPAGLFICHSSRNRATDWYEQDKKGIEKMSKRSQKQEFEHEGIPFTAEDLQAAFQARSAQASYAIAIQQCGAPPCPTRKTRFIDRLLGRQTAELYSNSRFDL